MKNRLFYRQPAATPFEALALGNGHIGALVFGEPYRERIALNDDRLWSGNGEEHLNPAAIKHLDEAKALTAKGRLREAQDIVETYMVGRWSEAYMPLGDLRLTFDDTQAVTDYERSLYLPDGECRTAYRLGDTRITARYFVSFPDDVLVCQLAADRPGGLTFTVGYDSQMEHTVAAQGDSLWLSGITPDHVAPDYDKLDPVPIAIGGGQGLRFCAGVQVLAQGGSITACGDALRVEGADACTLLHTSLTAVAGTDYETRCRRCLSAAAGRADTLWARHTADFRPLFERVDFQLGEDSDLPTDERIRRYRQDPSDTGLIALLYAFGRYLNISSQRQGLPGNAQGIWNWDLRPAWSSNYTTNINIQLNYWATEKTALPECGVAYTDWLLSLVPRGERVAKTHYGARGYCMHHNIDGWGICTPSGGIARYMFWPVSGVWMCEQVFDHYRYTGDLTFLREKALPLLEGSVLFALDWLHKNEQGEYVSGLSTSPENTFYIDDSGKEIAVCEMTASDILLFGTLFRNYLHTVEVLGIDSPLTADVKERLEHLKKLSVDDDGYLMEWDKPYREHDPGHRHITPLLGIFPGTTELEDDTLRRASRKLFDRRLAAGGGMLGWSASMVAVTAARFKDGETAHKYISSLVSRCISPNLFDIYIRANELPETRGDGNYTYEDSVDTCCFQIDGNHGIVVSSTELLLQDCLGYIDLLPALPTAWHTGHITGLKATRDVTVDQYFAEGELTRLRIAVGDGFGGPDTLRVRYRGQEIALSVAPGDRLEGSVENGTFVLHKA